MFHIVALPFSKGSTLLGGSDNYFKPGHFALERLTENTSLVYALFRPPP